MNYNKGSRGNENVRNQRPNCVLKEIMLKVLIVGDYGVGKTAIIRRYAEGKFSSNYKVTIGADFSIKTIVWDNSTQVNMQLWDIAGNEKLGFMTRVYYKYAAAAIIVFDVSRVSTFQSVQKTLCQTSASGIFSDDKQNDSNEEVSTRRNSLKWLHDIRDKVSQSDGSPIPLIVLANKCDISGVLAPLDALNRLCKQYGVAKWYKTSAKNNTNIDEAMMYLVSLAMKTKLRENSQENDSILLHKNHTNLSENSCCG